MASEGRIDAIDDSHVSMASRKSLSASSWLATMRAKTSWPSRIDMLLLPACAMRHRQFGAALPQGSLHHDSEHMLKETYFNKRRTELPVSHCDIVQLWPM